MSTNILYEPLRCCLRHYLNKFHVKLQRSVVVGVYGIKKYVFYIHSNYYNIKLITRIAQIREKKLNKFCEAIR